jgi:hypothetical protein
LLTNKRVGQVSAERDHRESVRLVGDLQPKEGASPSVGTTSLPDAVESRRRPSRVALPPAEAGRA